MQIGRVTALIEQIKTIMLFKLQKFNVFEENLLAITFEFYEKLIEFLLVSATRQQNRRSAESEPASVEEC